MLRTFKLFDEVIEINEDQNTYIWYRKLFKALADQKVRRFKAVVSRECKSIDQMALKLSDIVDTIFFECVKRLNEMLYEFQIYDITPEEINSRFNRDYKNWRNQFDFVTATNDVSIVDLISEIIEAKCLELHNLFIDLLIEKQVMKEKPYGLLEQEAKAQSLLDEIRGSLLEDKEREQKLVQGISIDPFNREFYKYLLGQYGVSQEIYELAEYYGSDIRQAIKKSLISQMQNLSEGNEEDIRQIIEWIKQKNKIYPLIDFRVELELYEERLTKDTESEEVLNLSQPRKFREFITGLKKRWNNN